MRIVPLPPSAELEKLLAGLVLRDVKVKNTDAKPGPLATVALYRTEVPTQEVVTLCELSLAASLAAALSLVPVEAVKDAVAAGRLEESMRENLGEVMNVLSRFVSGSGRRFGLVQSWCPPEAADANVVGAAEASDETRVVAVDVPGYLGGLLGFNTI